MDDKFKIFSGTANPKLADDVCAFLGLARNQALVTRFKDGEAYVQIQENVRGADVFVIQPTSRPVDEHLMELLLMIDALKRASARRITAVIPYYGYGRQDRKDKPRAPISAKLVADMLTTAGADRALLIDPHAAQLQGFFNIPVDPLFASPVLVDYFKQTEPAEPDGSFAGRGRRGAGTVFCQEDGFGAGHRGQAARGGQRGRDHACDWRCERPHLSGD